MEPKFSEFTFGFGISYEIETMAHKYSLSAPILPSLKREKEHPWDINFSLQGVSLFLQFKLSEYFKRSYRAVGWNLFHHEFYRFDVYPHPTSPQHNRMIDLAATEPHVYYCAPLFYLEEDINSHFVAGTMLDSTVLVPTRGLQKLAVGDYQQHYIGYDDSLNGYFLSEPQRLKEVFRARQLIQTLIESRKIVTRGQPITIRTLRSLYATMRSAVIANPEHVPMTKDVNRFLKETKFLEVDLENPADLVRMIGIVAQTYFGLSWIIVGEPPFSD